MSPGQAAQIFPAPDYDLEATLNSGQAFRWEPHQGAWLGVLGKRRVRLVHLKSAIRAETPLPQSDWDWLIHYLQLRLDLPKILASFPVDAPMEAAVKTCRGLRLLRQDPWECLASFILSSTKQIVQIRQVVGLLCERFGETIKSFPEERPVYTFPAADRLAALSEAELRACRMGFRAPYLLQTARQVAAGTPNLLRLDELPLEDARAALLELPGVGRKIADCVLLFAYGFEKAFPVDVWVLRALKQLYFPKRHVTPARLHRFAGEHFGPHAGYAQQYLFHYMRTREGRVRRETSL